MWIKYCIPVVLIITVFVWTIYRKDYRKFQKSTGLNYRSCVVLEERNIQMMYCGDIVGIYTSGRMDIRTDDTASTSNGGFQLKYT